MFNCQILADSLSPQGHRLTTMKITFPRFILAEFNTHRMFSRNSASSRAIPFNKMVKMVIQNPFIPIAFQKEHKGMQGTEYLDPNKKYTFKEVQMIIHETLKKGYFNEEEEQWDESFLPVDEAMNKYVNPILLSSDEGLTCSEWWLKTRDLVIGCAYVLSSFGVTKQLVNRLLEPFMWHTVIVTATEWENFFKLRCPQYTFNMGDQDTDEEFVFKSKKDAIEFFGVDEIVEYDQGHGIAISDLTDMQWLELNTSQAEIHIQAIAELMWDAYNESKPKQLQAGEWHIPFGDNIDDQWIENYLDEYDYDQSWKETYKIKIAIARCARISYETLGDNPKIDYEADMRLHDTLLSNGHASPLEHCARVMYQDEYFRYHNGKLTDMTSTMEGFNPDPDGLGWCKNFKGFIQYRAIAGV